MLVSKVESSLVEEVFGFSWLTLVCELAIGNMEMVWKVSIEFVQIKRLS